MSYAGSPTPVSRSPKSLLLTATDIAAPVVMPVALLTGLALQAETEVLEWNKFFSRLMDPMSLATSQDIVWMILLQVEDWDHFLEHARNPAVAPSLEFLESKFSELTYLLNSVGNHLTGSLIVGLLPPPEEVRRNARLIAFRDKLCKDLHDALTEYPSIWIRNIPRQPTPECSIHEEDRSAADSRMVYRIPISARTLRGE